MGLIESIFNRNRIFPQYKKLSSSHKSVTLKVYQPQNKKINIGKNLWENPHSGSYTPKL